MFRVLEEYVLKKEQKQQFAKDLQVYPIRVCLGRWVCNLQPL